MLSLYDMAALMNLEPSDNLYCEPFPIDDETCILRFANTEDATVVHLKIERFKMISGGIIMWHGLLANIPADYALCDGNNGTPDLRDKFVRGSANGVDPGGVGGAINHNHTFTGDGHNHILQLGTDIAFGNDVNSVTDQNAATGTTDNEDGRPPFYDVAYIMKL